MNVDSLAEGLIGGTTAGVAAFAVSFIGGLVAGLGPCVLPMLPAVFGYVTGHVAEERAQGAAWRRSLALAFTFVLGMSLVFAAVGAAAGLLGRAIIIGGWSYYVVAAICVLLGLDMLDVLDLPFERLNSFLPATRPRGQGLLGAVLFGMLFGLIASPCSTPILAAIATIAAARGSALQGAGMLFLYGLGKGTPVLVLGIASGSLAGMRRLSQRTGIVTKVGGAALLIAAAYLVWIA